MDAIRKHQRRTAMPPSTIQYQDDTPIRASADCPCKVCKRDGENLDANRWKEQAVCFPRLRTNETVHIQPLVTVPDAHNWALSFPCPDAPEDWLEANTMLIHAPEFNFRLWMGLLDVFHLLWQFSLKCFLPFRICLVMTRTGDMQGESKMLEVIPPWLSVYLSLYLPTYPVGDFWASPQSAIRRGLLKQLE